MSICGQLFCGHYHREILKSGIAAVWVGVYSVQKKLHFYFLQQCMFESSCTTSPIWYGQFFNFSYSIELVLSIFIFLVNYDVTTFLCAHWSFVYLHL